jgi:hypothetical protein
VNRRSDKRTTKKVLRKSIVCPFDERFARSNAIDCSALIFYATSVRPIASPNGRKRILLAAFASPWDARWFDSPPIQEAPARPHLGTSFLPQLPDHGATEPEIKQRDDKNDSETKGRDEPLKPVKIGSLATPVEKQGSKANRDALKSHDDEVKGRARYLDPPRIDLD